MLVVKGSKFCLISITNPGSLLNSPGTVFGGAQQVLGIGKLISANNTLLVLDGPHPIGIKALEWGPSRHVLLSAQ